MQLWANDVLKPISRDGDVAAVCVHLNQLEVAAIEISIQEIVIELEHSLLCQLIQSNSDLERPIDRDTRLLAFQLIRLPELLQITEVRASQGSVHHLLILCVDHACLSLQRFNEFPVTAVSQQFEHLSQQSFVPVHLSCAAGLCHLLHKPSEDLRRLIVDRGINSFDDCSMFHIPTQW